MFNFIFGLILGMAAGWVMGKRGLDSRLRGNANQEAIAKKRENLQKVLAMAREKGQIANDDIQYALGISDATATRYLEELEREGKLEQIGSKKGVIYRIKYGSHAV